MSEQETISYAAFQTTLANGRVVRAMGSSHFECIETMSMKNGDEDAYAKRWPTDDIYGFLTSTNRFVDRAEAYEIAKNAGQLKHGCLEDHYLKSYNVNLKPMPTKTYIITVS